MLAQQMPVVGRQDNGGILPHVQGIHFPVFGGSVERFVRIEDFEMQVPIIVGMVAIEKLDGSLEASRSRVIEFVLRVHHRAIAPVCAAAARFPARRFYRRLLDERTPDVAFLAALELP